MLTFVQPFHPNVEPGVGGGASDCGGGGGGCVFAQNPLFFDQNMGP